MIDIEELAEIDVALSPRMRHLLPPGTNVLDPPVVAFCGYVLPQIPSWTTDDVLA